VAAAAVVVAPEEVDDDDCVLTEPALGVGERRLTEDVSGADSLDEDLDNFGACMRMSCRFSLAGLALVSDS
jgi:hypothetical protein